MVMQRLAVDTQYYRERYRSAVRNGNTFDGASDVLLHNPLLSHLHTGGVHDISRINGPFQLTDLNILLYRPHTHNSPDKFFGDKVFHLRMMYAKQAFQPDQHFA